MATRKKADDPTPLHTAQTRADVVRMYQEGHRVVDITRETGVPRATVYWILRKEGIQTDRVAKADDLTAPMLMEQLTEATREIGQLRADLERERTITRWFLERVILPDGGLAETLIGAAKRPARPRKQP